MVYTRSTKLKMFRGVMNLIHSSEIERIRNEYASSEEEEQKKTVVVAAVRKEKEKSISSFGSTSDYLQWLKSPSQVVVPPPATYTVEIDFDDAHDEWSANKRRKMNGNYVYICGAPLKNGKKCRRDCCDKIGLYSGCRMHYSWEESENKIEEPFRLKTF